MNQELVNLEEKKVEPLCPVFGECGGCRYQDLTYDEELKVKGENLRNLFKQHLDIPDSLVDDVVSSPEPYHYRNRLDLGIYRNRSGEVKMGFRTEGRHRTIPIETCAIAKREVADFLPQLREEAIVALPENYRMANLVVRTGDEGRVFWGGIGRGSLRMKEEDYFYTEIHGRRIYYSLATFFQANLSILPILMDKIRSFDLLHKETVFFDLYAGVGLFGIYFAHEVNHVVLMEESADSTHLAKFNIQYHQLGEKVDLKCGRVEDDLPAFLRTFEGRQRVAMIDPPRKGLHPTVVDTLCQETELESLMYLSCSPDSLVRDLVGLTKGGWNIQKVIPFDFFPKTHHLETLVLLSKHHG